MSDFSQEHLDLAERKGMTMGTIVSLVNDNTIWLLRGKHANVYLRTRKAHKILRFSSSCRKNNTWKNCYSRFHPGHNEMSFYMLLALFLGLPESLCKTGPAFLFSRGMETQRYDRNLTLSALIHGKLVLFDRLMKYVDPMEMGGTHRNIETYSYKCAAGLKTLLVEYLLMKKRHMTVEETNPETREGLVKANEGMPLLTSVGLVMRSDPPGPLGVATALGKR